MKDKMRIGELAEVAGVTPRTIRYYESLGLLGPCEREGHGFRYYSESELARLKKIDVLKQLGLRLEDIADIIPLFCEDPSGLAGKRRVLAVLEAHLAETDEKIADLQRFRGEVVENIDQCKAHLDNKKPTT